MKSHLNNTCPVYPLSLRNDRTQTVLQFPSTEGADLVAVTSRFDQLDCRNALAVYIILDEQPFRTLEDADAAYRDFFDDNESPPSDYDWENVRAFVKFLKYFYEATKVFSVSTQASLHTAFPHLATIYIELKKASMNLNGCFATVAKDMLQKYEKYWGNIGNMNQLLYFGVILDPRFKLRYVEWCFEDMYADDSSFKEQLLEVIDSNLSKMYDCYQRDHDKRNTTWNSASSAAEANSLSQTAAGPETTTQFDRGNAFQNHLKVIDSVVVETEL
ncbi:zinc finger BED domain-containing protein RICESLEEPER [Trifolium repens]|nr:zinc finger BED domain-containing protein RICESLEEPER [Trifolium repens]